MSTHTKPVRLSAHAQAQALRRGATTDEITTTIRATTWQPTQLGRFECRRDFPFGEQWNGRYYEFKQVRPIFVEEPDEIVVVTVYVYYF